MKDFDTYAWIALGLVIIGGINWLLVGLVQLDLITTVFGRLLGRLIFILVGAGACYLCYLIYLLKIKKTSQV